MLSFISRHADIASHSNRKVTKMVITQCCYFVKCDKPLEREVKMKEGHPGTCPCTLYVLPTQALYFLSASTMTGGTSMNSAALSLPRWNRHVGPKDPLFPYIASGSKSLQWGMRARVKSTWSFKIKYVASQGMITGYFPLKVKMRPHWASRLLICWDYRIFSKLQSTLDLTC